MRQKKDWKVAVLNFASYRNPGGGYITGGKAQEEDLCADSFLYNVLSSDELVDSYYSKHDGYCYHGLYNSNALYSPDVIFFNSLKCDVITCAAVNRRATGYANIPESECLEKMYERCEAVLQYAAIMDVDCLILGAYGCGIFKNDPEVVAKNFRNLLNGRFKGAFNTVVFPIPDDRTYAIFKRVLLPC